MKNRYLSEKAASRRSIVSEIRKDVFVHAEYRSIQDNGNGNAETGRRSGIRFSRCTESTGLKTGWDI